MAGNVLIVVVLCGLAALIIVGLMARRVVRIRRFQRKALRSSSLPATAAEFRVLRARDRTGVPRQRDGPERASMSATRLGRLNRPTARHARASRSLYVPRSPIVLGALGLAALAAVVVVALTRTSGISSIGSYDAGPGSSDSVVPHGTNDGPAGPPYSAGRSSEASASIGDARPVSKVAFKAKSSGIAQVPLHADRMLPADAKVQVKVMDETGREVVHADVTVGPGVGTSDVSVSLIAGQTYQAVVDGPGTLDVRVLG